MRWKIKFIHFKPFIISNEIPTNDSWILLIFLWIINSYFRQVYTNMHMSQNQFSTFNNLNGVFGSTLIGTQFNMCTIVFNALVYKDLDILKLLNILRTMSNNVWFLFSATPFWHGVLGNYPIFFKRNFVNRLGVCPSFVYLP